MMKKTALVILTAFSLPVFGTTFIEMDTTSVARCSFSSRHHNRIAIDNGRIKKIIFPEGGISVRIEEESGQAFIQTLSSYVPVTTISVITDEGEVQDIELSFSERSSEILILTRIKEMCWESSTNYCGTDVVFKSPFEGIIRQIMNGETPLGYVLGNNRKCSKKIKNGVMAYLTRSYVSENEEVLVWRVSNCSKRFKEICEEEVAIGNPDWVFIDKQELCPSESALAITAVSKI